MSLFNAPDATDAIKQRAAERRAARRDQSAMESPLLKALVTQNARLRRSLNDATEARKRAEVAADGMAESITEAPKPRMNTCGGCGGFYKSGPIPCRGCERIAARS